MKHFGAQIHQEFAVLLISNRVQLSRKVPVKTIAMGVEKLFS